MMRNGAWKTGPLLLAVLLFAATGAAQVYQGRMDITVVDSTGAVLPGVTVEITGPESKSATTDAKGEVHLLNLPPGIYQVKAMLAGFTEYQNRTVPVVAGGSVPLRIALKVAGVEEQVDVTAESPVIDTKKQTTATNVTLEELQNIPNARDPWVVMQTVPSIIVDRVNVGGAESGQQSNFTAKGAGRGDATWNLDGVPVTDMAATGATSTYFDFDAFQEISVTTGGADVQSATPGVQLNFAMKTGGDTPHGAARIYFENEGMQSNNMPADLAKTIGGKSGKGNRTEQYADYGFDLGGPLMKGKWWAWGSYGKTDVRIRTLTDVLDRTVLANWAFKTQAQVEPRTRTGFTFFRGDKLKWGRGASATRTDATTWNQSGPTSIYKGEASWAGNNLFLVGRYAYADMGFQLVPRGGMESGKEPYLDDSGVWHNSFVFYKTTRPQKTFNVDANYFRGRQEFKFGYAWRQFPVDSISEWPGSKIITLHDGYPNLYVMVAREVRAQTKGAYQNFYVGDTISLDRMTINLGVRWDYQTSTLLDNEVKGVAGFTLLPGIKALGVENVYSYNDLTPRLGLTYALDENRKTQLRASYSIFASQLGAANSGFINPVGYSYIYYLAVDRNGDKIAQLNEILFNEGLQGYYGIDPDNPTKATSSNKVGDVKAPRTQEIIAGIDRELMPNFGLSASFTYRNIDRLTWSPLIGIRKPQYVQTGTLTGSETETGSYSVPYYALPASLVPPGGGKESINREGYHQRYVGLELAATKRLSNRWMARFGFSTNSHKEFFDDPNKAISDPNPSPTNPYKDGGDVVSQTGGSGKSQIYLIVPKYQFIANGLYQGPLGINFGANYVMRQGFGQPWFQSRVSTGDPLGRKTLLIARDVSGDRLPAVHSFDIRVEKAFTIDRMNVYVDLDVFNLGNAATVLGRQYDHRFPRTSPTGFGRTTEIMNPRIARLGVRLTF